MGNKYKIYDDEGNLVASVEKVTYEKEEMPFLSMPLFEFALMMMLALFGSMYPFVVVLYICVIITFIYLFIFCAEGYGAYINSMIIAFLHIAAFVGFTAGVALSLEQYEDDITNFFIICSFGILLSAAAFVLAAIGLVLRKRRYLYKSQVYEKKEKNWKASGVISVIVTTILMIASIVVYSVCFK